MTMPSTVLYIDDDREDLELFREAVGLISNSINFIPSESATDALQLLRQQKITPQLIFVDINMPVMDGKEFLMALKDNIKFKGIPVIILTTSSLDEEEQTCKLLGAKEFVTKPTTFLGLIQKLKTVMDV